MPSSSLAACGVLAALLVSIADAGFQLCESSGRAAQPRHLLSLARLRCVQALAVGQIVVEFTESNFMVALSFDLARSLHGPGFSDAFLAFFSGVIQASSPAGMMLGSLAGYFVCKLRNYSINRSITLFSPLVVAGVYVLLGYTLLFHPMCPYLAHLFIATKLSAGLLSGLSTIVLCTLSRDITPDSEQIALSIFEYTATAGGLASGPLISASVASSAPAAPGSYSREMQAISWIAGLYAMFACCAVFAMPRREPKQVAAADSDRGGGGAETEEGTGAGSALAMGGVCIFACIFCSAAVEVSSSLLLEFQYGWEPSAIGRAIAAVFFSATVLCGITIGLQSCTSSASLVLASSVGILGGVLLLFDLGVGWGALQLLLSDMVMYPCLTNLVAIIFGYMYMDRRTSISTEGLNFVVWLLDATARAVAPPLVRGVIGRMGRNIYASLQLSVSLLVVALAVALSRKPRSEMEEKADEATAAGQRALTS